jgi:hypothetical protein
MPEFAVVEKAGQVILKTVKLNSQAFYSCHQIWYGFPYKYSVTAMERLKSSGW